MQSTVRRETTWGSRPTVFAVKSAAVFGGEWPEGDEVAIRFGALDGDPGIQPQFHTFVTSRAPWDQIPDDVLPRYDEGYH